MNIIWIFLLLFFTTLMIKAADYVILSLRSLGTHNKAKQFMVSAVFMSLGTCFPELVVGITSALEGAPTLLMGNVLGSNISNISLVVGIAAFVNGGINIRVPQLKRDMILVIITAILPMLLILDGQLSRVDGLILLLVYGAYVVSFLKGGYLEGENENIPFGRALFLTTIDRFNHLNVKKTKELVKLFIGIALLLFSAQMVVKLAGEVTQDFDIPIFVVGLVFLGIGATLPDLAFSIRSIKDHETSMFLGNRIGSLITNWTLVVGITAFIHPIEIESISHYAIAAVGFFAVLFCFWYFLKSKSKIERWEAAILILLYVIFMGLEFI